MAKVSIPALSGTASGKIGDVVFFRRWGQDIARIRVKPANPRTFKQQTVRHNLAARLCRRLGRAAVISSFRTMLTEPPQERLTLCMSC